MAEEEEMVHCPYNFSHVVLKSRFPTHLIKCRQQHPVKNFATCPFNSVHDVPAAELQCHIKICPDRKMFENYMYVIGEPKAKEEPPVPEIPASFENWDKVNDSEKSYLDVKNKKLEKELVFRQPVGMTKSERKMFFKNEVRKFEEVRRSKQTEDAMPSFSASGSKSERFLEDANSGHKDKQKKKP